MVDNLNQVVEDFNSMIEKTKNSSDFNEAIESLNGVEPLIETLQHTVNEMKQVRHDLTQDVYNKFKNKNYVKRIKFL
jgi:hypothetical protein